MKTILVIEDEQSIADTVIHGIRREGYDAVWKDNGLDGLAFLEQNACDLVVLDVGLPDISGFEICKSIRARSPVPVIFLTARDDEVDKIVGLEIGADDYMTKPFSPRELAARIKTVLRRTGGGTHEAETVPAAPRTDLTINTEKLQAFFRGSRLELTRYEFKLLALLAAHPGRVFSREAIMNAVWDSDSPSLDRTVDAHIKSLRAKIREIAHSEDIIITHRGMGYAMRDGL